VLKVDRFKLSRPKWNSWKISSKAKGNGKRKI
jgi:hypothetical protein